ncbi:MAG: carbamoyl-phosphate synthase large subunit [Nitrospinota bacterium]
MPKREDIKKIMLIGAGPIVIGQACEFDYSGTQACKALKEEGYEVILVNSNPATIMTDPDFADRTYIEPINADIIEKIIAKERPDAILPTMGGQTALNAAMELADKGILAKYNVELIGASVESIRKAEDRKLFKAAMERINLKVPESGFAHSESEAMEVIEKIGFPVIIRPSFTLGGTGGGVAYNIDEFKTYVIKGLKASPTKQILIEQSLIGWKEFELEVMRDRKDNVVIICSIENFDPMGVHTGDSITVAPAQTLTDKEYQLLRDASIKIMREIGVDTGGSNVQFGVNPDNGELVVVEMNPRVSRSSALASKATGFPIAKFAAKLAVGYTLDEIPNDITKSTPASFEPMIDYCVVKFPRFTFEKFPQAEAVLNTQMKSVGEAMSIGRTFKEAFQKVLRSLEINSYGLEEKSVDQEVIRGKLRVPNWERVWYIADAFRIGMGLDEVFNLSKIDRWFLDNILEIVEFENSLKTSGKIDDASLLRAKKMGFSDIRLGQLLDLREDQVRRIRIEANIRPVFKMVDTCAAEFASETSYFYSTYEEECESAPTDKKKIMILGGGPNRIGQGIEFDYCCVHGSMGLKDDGFETIMVNCNPETVSTDYDTSDRLYFEPITFEDVMAIVDIEKPDGVIVQFGGQTPLKLAKRLFEAGVKIIGTSPVDIDRAEDRKHFKDMLDKLGLKQPPNGIVFNKEEALIEANRVGYPVVVRPSYVLGGRAMEIVYDDTSLERYMTEAVNVSPEMPVLIDRFLEKAIEVDVDAVSDGDDVVIAGIMEHIEEAGVHSGDSACSLPPFSLSKDVLAEIRRETVLLAKELNVVGLMNIQFAIKGSTVYLLEVNPRASRTVPFVSKATGRPFAKIAARVMAGAKLKDLGVNEEIIPKHFSVKEAVFPFVKFPGEDSILGPEMKSTGEVMGIDDTFESAFIKSQFAAGMNLADKGKVFISVVDRDKEIAAGLAKKLVAAGFEIVATKGTADYIEQQGIKVERVEKINEGRPNIVDFIKNGTICLMINTIIGKVGQKDSYYIRKEALTNSIPYCTTINAAEAVVKGIIYLHNNELRVKPIQEYHL